MGKRSDEALDLTLDDFATYLRTHHSAYVQVGETTYYVTDVNEHAWRVQDTNTLNEKGHFTDASDLVQTVSELIELPFLEGQSLADVFEEVTIYASVKDA